MPIFFAYLFTYTKYKHIYNRKDFIMLTNLDNSQIKSFMDSKKELDFDSKAEACEIIQKLINEINEKDKIIDSYKLRK